MAFDNVRFPTAIARGASGGPERRTEIVSTASGREERNSRWAHSRRRYDVGVGVKSLGDLHNVINFFEARRGRLHAFRFKDHADFKSCAAAATQSATDQVMGLGTGNLAAFQLVKTYGAPDRPYARVINAPVAGTVLVAVNSTATVQFTLDAATGVVTFYAGQIPALGAVVTAGFEFDVPVRFDTDQISINLTHFAGGEVPEIALIEVKP
jgi:uncharacterized protein (TIGR02217 family)